MKFDKVHCYFEQSGTFKNAFRGLGFEAFDYDIMETEDVNYNIDIFKEIEMWATEKEKTYFSKMDRNDLVIAFFPCTYFSDQSQLLSRGDSFGQKKWDLMQKLYYSFTQMEIRSNFYKHLCWLVEIALQEGFKLIIENPYGKVNFLKQFFPVKPQLVIKDRTKWGGFFKKPTQFFFINCEPSFHLQRMYSCNPNTKKVVQELHGFERSIISKEFARNFIENVILD